MKQLRPNRTLRPFGHVSLALGAVAFGVFGAGVLHPGKGLARSTPDAQLEIAPLGGAPLRAHLPDRATAPTIRQASTDTLGADWPAIFGTPPPPQVEEPAPEPQAAAPEEPDPGPFVSEDYRLTGSVLGAGADLAFIRDSGEELIVRQGSILPGGGEVIAVAAGEVRVQHDDGSISLIVPPGTGDDHPVDMQLAEAASEAVSSDPDPSALNDDLSDDEWLNDWDDAWDDAWDRAMQDILDEEWEDEDWDDGWDGQWDDEWDHMVDDDHEPTPEEMGQ